MSQENNGRIGYGETRRRIMCCADRNTERRILEAQDYLSSITGQRASLSVAITYLVKNGHAHTVATEQF